MSAPVKAAAIGIRTIAVDDLHGSVADPLLESMNFLNEVTTRYPDAISFAPGRPYEGLFDVARITDNLDAYLGYLRSRGHTEDEVRTLMFQYGRTKGQIHGLVAEALANDEGIRVDPESVVVTVGAQEGMILALRALFAGPSEVLLASSPCYIGLSGAARLLDVPLVPVPEGEHGPDPELVRAAARRVAASGRRVRAFYVVPDFANPSGASMPTQARRRLLEVAAAEDFLILEDNPYGFFGGDPEPHPTLKALDPDGSVVYLGSFCKTCFPGARLGYVVADQRVRRRDGSHGLLADELAKIKSMITVNTPSLSQAVIGGALVRCGCRLRAANAEMAAFYRANLAAVQRELERHFPPAERAALGLDWNRPDGGFFTVLTVPFTADEAALERSARGFGVLWTPMGAFFAGGAGRDRLRLSSSYLTPERLQEGVTRLAAFLRAEAAHGSSRPKGTTT
jgi:(S)-3,5-dihydroxyphenylglycine transaminase